MFRRSFDSILDECLAALRRGESLEDCLARYPQHAQRLRPLLSLALRLGQTPRSEPRPSAQAAAWQRFRLRAAQLRAGRGRGAGIGWLRPLALAASLLIALFLAGGATVYAAQDSLPDSPLYRVKLATEEVRLFFTFDDADRASLLLDQSRERTQEIRELLQRGRPIPGSVLSALRDRNQRALRLLADRPQEGELLARAREQIATQEDLLLAIWDEVSPSAQDDYAALVAALHNARLAPPSAAVSRPLSADDLAGGVLQISGTVEPASDGIWRFGGVEVRVDERTLGDLTLTPGQTAKVIAARGANGRLHALSLAITGAGAPEPPMLVSGAVEEVSDDSITVAGQRIAITRSTLLKLKLEPGRRVEITVNELAGQAVAAEVEPASAPAVEEGVPLAYEGQVERDVSTARASSRWLIGGQTFIVTPATVIDARAGALAPGARVRVEAVSQDGQLLARRVTTLAGRAGDEPVRLDGLFQGVRGGSWLVSGMEVIPPAGASLPQEGALISIVGQRQGNRLVGEEAIALAPPDSDDLVQIEGAITSIGQELLRIGLARVRLTEETRVVGEPVLRARTTVWGRAAADGTLEAVYINVLDAQPLR